MTDQATPAPLAAETTVLPNSQQWKGMDGAIAFQLIERHSDNWADIGLMMGEWLAANAAAPLAAPDDIAKAIHYPECWDTAAYPTLADALHELEAWFRCSNDQCAAAPGSAAVPPVQEPVAFVWHEHLGEKTKSLRWAKPTQWDYTTKVEPLYTTPTAAESAAVRELVEGLEQISKRCPPYTGDYTADATPSDFGNPEDYAREMQAMQDAATGDISRALLAKYKATADQSTAADRGQ